jgi:maltose O-acetyltransferase
MLIWIYRVDRLRFALFRARFGQRLRVQGPVSPNLRLMRLRVEPEGCLEIAPGVVTERQRGNEVWVQAGAHVRLGPGVWLRTEHASNQITAFPGARIEIGPRALLNGAMLHSKGEIRIGADSLLGFGVRVIDADLHDLDCETPERIGQVHIGERVWIGSDVTVLRGVTIGDDTVVGAGAVVTRDLPPRVLALGMPAKPVRSIASRIGCR